MDTENLVNLRVKTSLLWILIMVGLLFHTQFELSELFVKINIRIEGANGEMPKIVHLFRVLIIFIPLLLSIGVLYTEKKVFKILSFVYAILLGLLNTAHLIEEIGKSKLDISQIILLSLVLFFNILLIVTINKWRKLD